MALTAISNYILVFSLKSLCPVRTFEHLQCPAHPMTHSNQMNSKNFLIEQLKNFSPIYLSWWISPHSSPYASVSSSSALLPNHWLWIALLCFIPLHVLSSWSSPPSLGDNLPLSHQYPAQMSPLLSFYTYLSEHFVHTLDHNDLPTRNVYLFTYYTLTTPSMHIYKCICNKCSFSLHRVPLGQGHL